MLKLRELEENTAGFIYLLIIFAIYTVFSFLVLPGHYTLYGDLAWHYLPEIMHKIDPKLLNNDLATTFLQTNFTIYDDIIIGLHRVLKLNLLNIINILDIITKFIIFWGLFDLSYWISKRKIFSLFLPLVFLPPITPYLFTFIRVFNPYGLVPRNISFALSLIAISFYRKERYVLAGIMLLVALAFHVITPLPVIGAVFYYKTRFCEFDSRAKFLIVLTGSVILLTLYFIVNYRFTPIHILNLKIVDDEWLNILRSGYLFLFFDQQYNIIYLLLLPVGIISYVILYKMLSYAGRMSLPKKDVLKIHYLVIFSLLSAIIGVISSLFPVQPLLSLQLLRGTIFFRVILLILFLSLFYDIISYKINNLFLRNTIFLWLLTILVVFNIVYEFMVLPLTVILFVFTKSKGLVLYSKKRYWSVWLIFLILLSGDIIFLYSSWSVLLQKPVPVLIYFVIALNVCILFAYLWSVRSSLFAFKTLLASMILLSGLYALSNYSEGKDDTINRILRNETEIFDSYLRSVNLKSYLPEYRNRRLLNEVFSWIKDHTNENDVFYIWNRDRLVGAWLRNRLLRNVFVLFTDGGKGVFNRRFAIEWYKRMKIARKIDEYFEGKGNFPEEVLSDKYHIDYFIVPREIICNREIDDTEISGRALLRKVFENKRFVFYRLGNKKEQQHG